MVCLSDVDECDDPGVCGTARCENTDGGYNCLCDIGYVYDNQTKSCVGKCVRAHNETQTQSSVRTGRRPALASAGLDAAGMWGSGKECKDIRRNSV